MKPGSDTAKARVVILTDNYRIKCNLNIVPGVRLTDYIRSESSFVAVTSAEVYNIEGRKMILSADFMDINKDHIQIIAPDEMVEQQPADFLIHNTLE
ncbi:MAG: hypothetical protein KUG83_08965 [Gammaproteobacteria bacterium]|nr:hypothetical protein [Gammaproteobacteria bacterium]